MSTNLKRFLLHVAFAASAAAALWAADNVAGFGVPAEYQPLILAIATASASFFRGKVEETK